LTNSRSWLDDLAADDARLGRTFTRVGTFGLVAALVAATIGTAVVWSVVNSMDRSLTVTANAVAAADDTVRLAAETITIVSESFDTLVPAANLAAGSFEDAGAVIADSSQVVTVDVPDALDSVLDAMPAIESVAGIIDTTLGALAFFGADYEPDVPFDQAVAEVAEAIEPLPALLRAQADPLDRLATDFEEFGAASAAMTRDLAAVQEQLDEASLLLTEYAATAADASLIVADIQDNLSWQRWLMVGGIVLLSLAFAALQIVPLTLGKRLSTHEGAAEST
jgi:methyl-accepting chemotaxis protein